MSDDALNDEILSINAIYGDDTLLLLDALARVCALKLPSGTSVTIRIQFPKDYPDSPPKISGTESVGEDAVKGAGSHTVDVARRILTDIFVAGEPCIFALVEEWRELSSTSVSEPDVDHEAQKRSNKSPPPIAPLNLEAAPSWIVAPPISEKKSVFSGRLALVESPEQAKFYLEHFLATDKKAAKATHNIVVWRIQGKDSATYQDYDDGGETAAGGRLLHLLQLMDVWNVMVVVTRWYGGIHLGPDRFRFINNAARNALELGGLVKEGGKRAR